MPRPSALLRGSRMPDDRDGAVDADFTAPGEAAGSAAHDGIRSGRAEGSRVHDKERRRGGEVTPRGLSAPVRMTPSSWAPSGKPGTRWHWIFLKVQ